jgi:hypothetical protein
MIALISGEVAKSNGVLPRAYDGTKQLAREDEKLKQAVLARAAVLMHESRNSLKYRACVQFANRRPIAQATYITER